MQKQEPIGFSSYSWLYLLNELKNDAIQNIGFITMELSSRWYRGVRFHPLGITINENPMSLKCSSIKQKHCRTFELHLYFKRIVVPFKENNTRSELLCCHSKSEE